MSVALIMAAVLAAQDAAPPPAASVTPFAPAYFAEYRPNTAMDMVSRLPGFSINTGGGGRGFGEGGNVLIDGERPASKSDSVADVLRRIPASSVARIELIQGGAPGVDMQGHTMVARVIRKPGGGVKGAVTLAVTGAEDSRAGPSGRIEAQREKDGRRLDGALAANFHTSNNVDDGPRIRVSPTTGLLLQNDRLGLGYVTAYAGNAAYETPLGVGRLRATLVIEDVSVLNTNYDTGVFPTPGTVSVEANAYAETKGEVGARYTRALGGIGNFEGSVLHQTSTSASSSFFGTAAFTQDRESAESIIRGAARFKPVGKWTFDGGAETALNTLTTTSILTGSGGSLVNPAIEVEERRSEVFATARYVLRPGLNLEAGLRFETSQISTTGGAALEKTLSYWKPRALVTWSPQPGRQFSLRVEREVGQLSFGDFSASVQLSNGSPPVSGNPNLEPDQSWVAEARYDQRFGTRGSFTIQYSERRWEQIIDTNIFPVTGVLPPPPTLLASTDYYQAADNVGSAWRRDLSVNFTTPLDQMGVPGGILNLHAQAVRSAMRDPITGLQRIVPSPPELLWDAHFSQDIARLKIKWGFDVFGAGVQWTWRPTETVRRRIEPGANIFVERRFGSDTTVRVGANNIFDRTAEGQRTAYNNPRDRGTVAYVEDRALKSGRFFYVNLRRNF